MKKCYFSTSGQFRMGGTRIENNLKRFAPSDIIFVDTIAECDFVVLHAQMKYDLDTWLDFKKPLIFLVSEIDKFPNAKKYYDSFFTNVCNMVYTFHPLKDQGYKGKNLVLGAWGVDLEVFNIDPEMAVNSKRENNTMAFSYYDSEMIFETYMATRLADSGKMLHTDFKIWDFLRQGLMFDPKWHSYKEWISDDELKEWYMSCRFTNSLRGGAGFEATVAEAILCGSRPICFDSVYYRQWYEGLVVFVPEGEYEKDLVDNLVQIYKNPDKYKVTINEINEVRNKFGWQTVATNFWKEVMISL